MRLHLHPLPPSPECYLSSNRSQAREKEVKPKQPPLCVSVWGTSWGCGKEEQRAGAPPPPIPPTCIADDTHSVKQWHTCHSSAVKVRVMSPLPCLYCVAIDTLDSIIYKQSQDWCSQFLLLYFSFSILSLRYFSALACFPA